MLTTGMLLADRIKIGEECSTYYQVPLILTVLLHVAWQTLSISQHVPLSGHNDIALFE